jgi:NAD(P)-dependent dehydrogenase (short-subunit alcohol dehydrogenase family)
MNKTVLITGCSSAFGLACAKLFARHDWNVVATLRQPEAASLASGGKMLVTRLDVQDPDSIARSFEAAAARFGHIDLVINNAGFGLFGLFETTPIEKIAEQFQVNVFGVMDVTRTALPYLRANGGGVILNVSSGAGVFTLPMLSLYCASKFALEGFSEALSYELASQNIVVKIVEPGGVLGTDFGKRSGQEAGGNTEAPAYAGFIAQTGKVFDGLRANAKASVEDVAEVIYRAATDGSPRLRYVATPDIEERVRARRETSEDAYMAFMRSHFQEGAASA